MTASPAFDMRACLVHNPWKAFLKSQERRVWKQKALSNVPDSLGPFQGILSMQKLLVLWKSHDKFETYHTESPNVDFVSISVSLGRDLCSLVVIRSTIRARRKSFGGESEIAKLDKSRIPRLHEDVIRLDIAMYHALFVMKIHQTL